MTKQTLISSALLMSFIAMPQATLGAPAKRSIYEVELLGIRPELRKVLLIKLASKRGGVLDKHVVATDVRRLWRLGLFKDVRAEIDHRAGKQILRFVVQPRTRLRTIGVSGNRSLSQAQVFKKAKLKLDTPLSGVAMARAAENLRAHYRERGHAAATVSYELSESSDRNVGHVRFKIAEGPRFRLGKITIVGAPRKYRSKLAAIANGVRRKQNLYSPRTVDGIGFLLTRELRNRSHIYARVSPSVVPDPKHRRVHITYTVALGGRARVEFIRIRGNAKTRDRIIRRQLTFSPGDYYSDAGLITTQRRIRALGFFEGVDIIPVPGSNPALVGVEINVKERKTGNFQLGAGFSSAEGFIASGRIVQQNLFGRGQTLSLSAQLSGQRQLFDIRFSDPYVFGSDYSFSTSLYNSKRAWPGFTRSAVGGSLTLGKKLGTHTSAYLSHRLEHTTLSQIGGYDALGSSVAPLFRDGLTSAVRVTLVHDTRNDRLFPTRGLNIGAYAEVASPALGSQNQFTKLHAWFRHYRPLAGPFRLRFNAEAGLITSRDPLGAPLGERFQLGGITDIRGFAPGGIGPRLSFSTSDPAGLSSLALGGNLRLLSNTEVAFNLSRKLGIEGLVFFDIGNVFNLESRYCSVGKSSHSSTLCPGSMSDIVGGLRKSVGFGLRWRSPIGPLRFEWGIPLDRLPGEEKIRFHFSIGTSF